jgi:hypothetical protein
MRVTTDKLYYDIFGVGEKLHCFWDCNIPALNLEFLNSIDHEYFNYLADIHSGSLTGPHKLRAAIALRTAYFHGLETLFSLIFAGLHALPVIPAWILKCRTEELRNLVGMVNSNQQAPNVRIRFEEYSWKSISAFFNGTALIGNAEQDKAVEDFGKLWQLFADDYADSFSVDAYNSFKHGFRVRLGGMKISFQPVKSSENPDPPKDYQELGNSEFGVTFYVADKIKEAPDQKPDQHFRIKDCHVNCYPEYTAESLRLISVSIHNVVSCLKKLSGGEKAAGLVPGSGDWFNELCRKRTGLNNLIAETEIHETNITRFDKKELQKLLDSKKGEIRITY